jgi:hypothetical protein
MNFTDFHTYKNLTYVANQASQTETDITNQREICPTEIRT